MTGKLQAVAVVIRTYNNSKIAQAVRSYLTMEVGRIYVVVNAAEDKENTRGFLGALMQDARVQVLEMLEGYSWSNALNRALMAIQIGNVRARQAGTREIRFVFNASVEAQFTLEQVSRMLDEATDDPAIGVVGTSFEGRQDGNEVSLGRSYRHPRNTGMVVRLEALGSLFGGFDPWCDDRGGMEDIDFILRMLALSPLTVRMLNLKVRLIVGKNHHQPTKERNEQKAMDEIIGRWRALFLEGSEERTRIDAVIAEMGIEAMA